MDVPLKKITAAAVATAYLTTSTFAQKWSLIPFLRYLAGSWMLAFACWMFWIVILYPKLFSPLIGLPEPKNPSWFNGQYSKIQDQPTGWPMLEWYPRPLVPQAQLLSSSQTTYLLTV